MAGLDQPIIFKCQSPFNLPLLLFIVQGKPRLPPPPILYWGEQGGWALGLPGRGKTFHSGAWVRADFCAWTDHLEQNFGPLLLKGECYKAHLNLGSS